MSAADTGADQRAMEALQAKVADLSARLVALEADAVENPEPPVVEPVDPDMPSEADRVAMRERLRARTLAGIEANKKDSTRAGRTYRREWKRLTDVE